MTASVTTGARSWVGLNDVCNVTNPSLYSLSPSFTFQHNLKPLIMFVGVCPRLYVFVCGGENQCESQFNIPVAAYLCKLTNELFKRLS